MCQKERENKLRTTTIEKIFSDDTPNICPNEKHALLKKVEVLNKRNKCNKKALNKK
jgi:hypothetical protein